MSYSSNKGQRISEGGLAGQILIKASNTDYDTTWTNNSGIINSVFGRIGAVVAAYGDYNSAQVTQGATNLYFTNTLTRAAITASSPLSFSSGVVSISQANGSTNGYLSSTDWNTFNSKGNATVTNIAMTVPAFLAVTGTPITTGSGTFAIASASGLTTNSVLATPNGTTGAVSVRALVANDIPNISAAKITTGVLSPAVGGVPLGFFGSGSDGDVTLTSGVLILARDMFYRNLVITGTASILPTGFRIFVSETLDLTNAPANAINRNAGNGGNASGSTGGSGASALAAASLGGTAGSNSGSAGGTGIITPTQIQATAITAQATSLGGSNGASGGGGTTSGSLSPRTQVLAQTNSFYRVDHHILRGAQVFGGGLSAAGGTSGAGDNTTNAGAGGGGGGSGSGIICIFAKTIARDSTTASGCISVNGGSGGNGALSTGQAGGGGGAGGAGGGVVILYFANLTGSIAYNAIRAFGGNGGNGGNSNTAVRSAGQGGQGGSGGRILLFDVTQGTITETNGTQTLAAAPAVIASGDQVGGTGTTGVQTQTDL